MRRSETKNMAKKLFDLSIKICLMARHDVPNKETIAQMRKTLEEFESKLGHESNTTTTKTTKFS